MPPLSPLLDCGIDLDTIELVVSSLYFVLFIPALLLNIMAAWISWNLKTKSSFIVYLKNLVAADILMTLMIPLRYSENILGSPRGLRAFNCQFSSVLFYLGLHISIVLMGIISLDRFFKVVQPCGKMLGQSAQFGRVVSVIAWGVLLSVDTIPTMVLTNENPANDTAYLCMVMKNDLGKKHHDNVIAFCNVIFLVVLVVIGFSYMCIAKRVTESYQNSGSKNTRGKKKVRARVFIVLVVFLVCFAPYHIMRFFDITEVNTCPWAVLKATKAITLWISTTNVCMDPLIYFLLCKAFRKKLFEIKLIGQWCSSSAQINIEDASH